MHLLALAIPRFIQLSKPLLPLKSMAQSRHGVTHNMEAQVHPLAMAIPKFIRMRVPLLPLKTMVQSRRGVY
ncbi:hypothetical protein BAZSYMA_ACONTIG169893_1 [Bathymodiolus azoricus thioautotrophic gill symbiont]|nr:hypothetical protein BAZSYMA_ACONTIG169893_1 [Bathymodiolus azoricus thioautotrophic gill symbiont]